MRRVYLEWVAFWLGINVFLLGIVVGWAAFAGGDWSESPPPDRRPALYWRDGAVGVARWERVPGDPEGLWWAESGEDLSINPPRWWMPAPDRPKED